MKIKEVEIKNFRNIKEQKFLLDQKANLIIGRNELGKSNSINAIMWLLSDTFLTDNYGVGENDIDSIIPYDFKKGMHTSVSVTLEDDSVFTKTYKTSYKRGTDEINGHITCYEINGIPCGKKNDFYNPLFEKLNFKPTFNKLEIKEVNLFTDPLYALLKLDAKQLRSLLVGIGCSVTNDEIYKLGYEKLKPFEEKYRGNFSEMRKDYNRQRQTLIFEIEKEEAVLKDYNDALPVETSEFQILEKEKEQLIEKRLLLKNSESNLAVKKIDLNIKSIEQQKEQALQTEIFKIDSKIQNLNDRLQNISEEKNIIISKKQQEVKNQLSAVQNDIDSNSIFLKKLDDEIKNHTLFFENFKKEASDLISEKRKIAMKLASEQARFYNNFFTCPNCGKEFPMSVEDQQSFETTKRENIESFKSIILRLNKKSEALKTDYEKREKELSDVKKQHADASLQQTILLENKAVLEKKLREIPLEFNEENSMQSQLQKEISELKNEKQSLNQRFKSFDDDIFELKRKRSLILQNENNAFNSEISSIETKISEQNEKIGILNKQQSRYEIKIQYENSLKQKKHALNDLENMLALVNGFIQTMISSINKKATEKTGITFVMLEENITNDGVKEVCYATHNGIPFANISTSQKIVIGIRFIEKLKEIAKEEFGVDKNDLPIIVDKLECFDDVNRLKFLTEEQLIGTMVTMDQFIKIMVAQ